LSAEPRASVNPGSGLETAPVADGIPDTRAGDRALGAQAAAEIEGALTQGGAAKERAAP
jgi:hypothetical protein